MANRRVRACHRGRGGDVFAMFALEGAVYEYVYAVETADFGDYDIMISAKSGGDRLALVEPLEEVAGVSSFVPTVSVYALLENGDDGEYIRLRGFSRGDIEKMNSVKVASGNAEELFTNSDNVIISEAMSRALGIGVGDRLSVASLASSGGSRGFFASRLRKTRVISSRIRPTPCWARRAESRS